MDEKDMVNNDVQTPEPGEKTGRAGEDVTRKKGNAVKQILFIIVSVILSFGIWAYASSLQRSSGEQSFSDIPVKINVAPGFSVLNPYDYTIDVTVSGNASNLKKLSIDSFSATVDATEKTEPGKYSFTISLDYPSTVQLVSQSVRTVVLEIDKIASAKFDVELSLGSYDISEPYEIGNIECGIDSVTVSGPSKTVSRIARAVVETDAGHLTESTTFGAALSFYDESGAAVDSSQLSYPEKNPELRVSVFTKKTIPLIVSFAHGYFDSVESEMTVSPSFVTIKGESEYLSTVNEIVLEGVDEKLFTGNTVEYEITLPENTYPASDQTTAKITVKLTGCADTSYFIPKKNIRVNNPGNLKLEFLSGGVEIALRGPDEKIASILSQVITASVDLSAYNPGSGTVSIPVTIIIPAEYSDSVYEIGSYTILSYIGT